jgi:hypothetical protein
VIEPPAVADQRTFAAAKALAEELLTYETDRVGSVTITGPTKSWLYFRKAPTD